MSIVGQILQYAAGIGALVCFILVLVQMFQHNKTGLGIACIVLVFCCAIGGLIAFIYGWVKHREWRLTNVMIIWTVCVVVHGIGHILHPVDIAAIRQVPGL